MMLLALGLGSQFGTMEGVITNMFDMNIRVRKEILTGGCNEPGQQLRMIISTVIAE